MSVNGWFSHAESGVLRPLWDWFMREIANQQLIIARSLVWVVHDWHRYAHCINGYE